ncbi:MAG: Crp/Fnr family transcriptional regulator [Parvularculaceae bacterium]|nr:Crp/Fnr family transcriptional regulator [Parvularculaceae bacterium]
MTDLVAFRAPPLLAEMEPNLQHALLSVGQSISYTDGQLIHGRGDDAPGFSIVREGAVRFSKTLRNGRELTIGVLGEGSGFGEATLFGGQARAYDAFAQGPTVVHQISKPAFDRLLAEHSALAQILLRSLTRRLYGTLNFLDDLRALPIHLCIARVLANLSSGAKGDRFVECTQQDLAMTLGVTRMSVGTALSKLQAAELIKLHYRRIEIRDPAALERWIEGQIR